MTTSGAGSRGDRESGNATNSRLRFLKDKEGAWAWDKLVAIFVSLAGVVGGATTFFYKEIYTPAAVPVNVSMSLEIKPLPRGASTESTDLIPVQLSVSARNESNRFLRINKTHWVAHARPLDVGQPMEKSKAKEEADFIADVNNQMALGEDNMNFRDGATSAYQKSDDKWDPVGFGPLFDNNEIRPKEEIRAQRLIYLPARDPADGSRRYRLLRVKVSIPTYNKRNLADEDLVRVFGGFLRGGTDYVGVYFCQAERTFRENRMRWWFDKFLLPRDSIKDPRFNGPEVRYCPSVMSQAEREQIGAQVFTSSYEIDLDPASIDSRSIQK